MSLDNQPRHHSFRVHTKEYNDKVDEIFRDQERKIAQTSINNLRDWYNELSPLARPPFSEFYKDQYNSDPISAAVAATAEYGVLQSVFPPLFDQAKPANSLWRYLRAVEMLRGREFERSKILAIGTATLAPDYVGVFLKPPTVADMEATIVPKTSIDVTHSAQEGLRKEVSFYDGTLYAIEPDDTYHNRIEPMKEKFSIPKGSTVEIATTIQEALSTNVIPGDLDMVIWHRADPHDFVFDIDKTPTVSRQDLQLVFEGINGLVKPGGVVMVSIGNGNDAHERKMREEFMRTAVAKIPKLGYQRYNFPYRMTTYPYDWLFGRLGSGIVEAATFIKR